MELQAVHGQKTIRLRVVLWTNDIAAQPGHVVPKKCWDSGVVFIKPNRLHDIEASDGTPFNKWADLPAAIEAELSKAGVETQH